jgi:general secretion pathway protein D
MSRFSRSADRAKHYGLNPSQHSSARSSPEQPPERLGRRRPRDDGQQRSTSTCAAGGRAWFPRHSQSRLIAKPQLRGREGVKLTLNLGDEIPVPSTVFTPFAAGGVSSNPLTSFSYRPVGVNVVMTPRVSYEGDILMDVEIESSTLGGNIDVAGQSLPTFGSRKVTTSLRLREGESHLLAGLLREEDRRSLRGLPGIMNLPILRQLFSDNDMTTAQTDIVMLLTPRIVRTHEITAEDLSPIFIGSQQSIGLSARRR